jgi:hypothetical protein
MRSSRGMGVIRKDKQPCACGAVKPSSYAKGGKVSKVNEAGNYTKPEMRKKMFSQIKNSATQGTASGQWSARKSQLLAKKYKERGGGYTN